MAPKAKAAAPAAAKPAAKPEAKAKAKAKAKEEEEPKMDPPDREEFDAAVEKIQEAIAGFQKEQAALAGKISERQSGKEEFFGKKAELRAQLDEFRAKIDDLMGKKEDINKAVGEKRQEGTDMRNQLNKMKKSIGYTNEAEIDDRIATIEYKLVTDTLTLKEEKEFLREIQDLKRSRPKVSQLHKMEDSLSTRDRGEGLRENIGSINEALNLYRDGRKKVSEELNALNESRKDQLGDLPKYIDQRDEISKKIQECIAQRNTLRDEFRSKEKEFNEWKAQQRKIKQDRYNEERQAKQAEWDAQRRRKKADEIDEQPYVQEITLLDQTILFCKSLVKEKGGPKEAEQKEIVHNNPEGTEILVRKELREAEYYYVPTSQKKKGKSKNKSAKEGGAKPIKHNAETFRLFDQLKLNAPITTEDIPATLEALEEKLESYKQKVSLWETKRDEKKQKILAGEALSDEEKEVEKEEQQEEEAEKEEEQQEEKQEKKEEEEEDS